MSTVNKKEVEKFNQMAKDWWNPKGKLKVLHDFNKPRLKYLKTQINKHFDEPFYEELKIADIGCGGGLISESFKKLGGNITGIDASYNAIQVAKTHALNNDLDINYLHCSPEELGDEYKNSFDVVFALEIIEHVENVEEFVKSVLSLLKPNGLLFISTINKNLKSLLFAKIAAEYILRWLPYNTHEYKKFIKPSELVSILEKENTKVVNISGIEYKLLQNKWQLTDNTSINYHLTAIKNK